MCTLRICESHPLCWTGMMIRRSGKLREVRRVCRGRGVSSTNRVGGGVRVTSGSVDVAWLGRRCARRKCSYGCDFVVVVVAGVVSNTMGLKGQAVAARHCKPPCRRERSLCRQFNTHSDNRARTHAFLLAQALQKAAATRDAWSCWCFRRRDLVSEQSVV